MHFTKNSDNTLNSDLLDEGEGDQVPGDNAVVHELQEGGESEGQHLAEAERRSFISQASIKKTLHQKNDTNYI